jgi:hypothetical protein
MTRMLTILLVAGVCAFAVMRGSAIVAFTRAQAAGRIDDGWRDVPGLAAAALREQLQRPEKGVVADTAAERAARLARYLAVAPLYPTASLALAGMRAVTGQAKPDILSALTMSSITGPHEEAMLWPRAIFALLQWDALPAEIRRRALADLAEAIDELASDASFEQAKAALTGTPPQARREIATSLRANGVSPRALARLGLAVAEP